jgi:hypothetical protein
MSRALPEDPVDLLNGRHEASEIAHACTIAFWLTGHSKESALFHLNVVHRKFAELADQLGYDITERETVDTGSATESNEAAE